MRTFAAVPLRRVLAVLGLVLGVVLALAGCATVTGGTGRPTGTAVSLSPSPTPVVKGWKTVRTASGVAYDVPPSWTVRTPTTVAGWDNDKGTILILRQVAELAPGYCPNDIYAAWRGMVGVSRAGGTPGDVVADTLKLVPSMFSDNDGSHRPTVVVRRSEGTRDGAQIAVGVATVTGIHRHSSCGPPATTFYVMGYKPAGRSVVLFAGHVNQGIPSAASPAVLAQIAATVRPI